MTATSHKATTRAVAPIGVVALLVCALATLGPGAGTASGARVEQPNFVVITTDDQSMHSYRRSAMPRTFDLFGDRGGTHFSNGLAAPPLCCPSRAGFLTGQYPHNHGVADNHPGYTDLRQPENVLPAWLSEAGYRSGFVGKYLNGSSAELGATPAPGWDYWYGILGAPRYWGAEVSNQGDAKRLPRDQYVTTKLHRKALDFIERSSGRRPFFLWLAEIAPHERQKGKAEYCRGRNPQPLPEDMRRFRHEPFHPRPSYNERHMGDKPGFLRSLPSLTAAEKRAILKRYRCTLAAMREVDRGVDQIVHKLKRLGELDETVIVFTSDNGTFFGEHRIAGGKSSPFEEAFRVPLALRMPRKVLGRRPDRQIGKPVSQIDLAPTFVALADARACEGGRCRTMDGRSLAPLLRGSSRRWPRDRGVLGELRGQVQFAKGPTCGFAAIRTQRWVLSIDALKRGDGSCRRVSELYDIERDPYQLRNLAESRAQKGRIGRLRDRLNDLRSCEGIRGRDPNPGPGARHCE